MMQFKFQSMGDIEQMKQTFLRKQRINGAIFGTTLLLIGTASILAQLGQPALWGYLQTWWPSLVILAFAVRLLVGIGTTKGALTISVIFGILQAEKLGYVTSFWGVFWPLILIILGGSILLKRFRGPKKPAADANVIPGAVVEYTDNNE